MGFCASERRFVVTRRGYVGMVREVVGVAGTATPYTLKQCGKGYELAGNVMLMR
jgi:hypothetical protein